MSGAAITAEDLRAAKWKLTLHLGLARGGYGYRYRAEQWPELVTKWYRPERGARERRELWVGDQRVPWGDLEQAAQLLNARRQVEAAA